MSQSIYIREFHIMGNSQPISPQSIFNEMTPDACKDSDFVLINGNAAREICNLYKQLSTDTQTRLKTIEMSITNRMEHRVIGTYKRKSVSAFYFHYRKKMYMLLEHDNPYYRDSRKALKEARGNRDLLGEQRIRLTILELPESSLSPFEWVLNVEMVKVDQLEVKLDLQV
jgi:hypothetical protein